jgi:hypothetical protein
MIDESGDLRPMPEAFARILGRCAREFPERRTVEAWHRSWNDAEGAWTNFRNFEYWLETAGV